MQATDIQQNDQPSYHQAVDWGQAWSLLYKALTEVCKAAKA